MKAAPAEVVSQPDQAQSGNRQWWTANTMSYDWKDKVQLQKFSAAWFGEIDRRFIDAMRYFAHDQRPFGKIIPYDLLAGKRVLEVGCGMGLHTELMTRNGARVDAIDISPTSVAATRERLGLHGLSASVSEMDAENLTAEDTYDFIWSWGVIHHSSRTGVVLRNLYRALKTGGEIRFMVYNLEGAQAYTVIASRYLVGFWFGKSLDQLLWQSTDGFLARYFSPDSIANLCRTFSDDVSVEVFGQESDALPVPRYVRRLIRPLFSDGYVARAVRRRGTFLQVRLAKPK